MDQFLDESLRLGSPTFRNRRRLVQRSSRRHGDLLLGNIFNAPLEEILTGPKVQQINWEIQRGVRRCQQTCPYFDFCGGGSPANKLSEHGAFDVTETLYCRLKIQATMDVVLEYVDKQSSRSETPS